MPPKVVVARAARRLGIRSRWLRRVEMLNATDAARPKRAVDIIEHALGRAGVQRHRLWSAMPSQRVIEIGCGQHGGLGPACVAAGASRYLGIDPGIDAALLDDAAVRDQWVRPALVACAEHVRPGLDEGPGELAARFQAASTYSTSGLEELGRGGDSSGDGTTLFMSISCLEHIHHFDAAFDVMAQLGTTEAAHVHLVNFSNHTSRDKPFEGLYETNRDSYVRQWGGHINGLRPPDVLEAFKVRQVGVQCVVLDERPETLPERIHPWWTERYSRETLSVRAALFLTERFFGASV
ncbi:MAG: hypothetical protein HOI95_18410 [Chromatiales bacterium]|nr:hypothetical protein [Chromatiales bacterium]